MFQWHNWKEISIKNVLFDFQKQLSIIIRWGIFTPRLWTALICCVTARCFFARRQWVNARKEMTTSSFQRALEFTDVGLGVKRPFLVTRHNVRCKAISSCSKGVRWQPAPRYEGVPCNPNKKYRIKFTGTGQAFSAGNSVVNRRFFLSQDWNCFFVHFHPWTVQHTRVFVCQCFSKTFPQKRNANQASFFCGLVHWVQQRPHVAVVWKNRKFSGHVFWMLVQIKKVQKHLGLVTGKLSTKRKCPKAKNMFIKNFCLRFTRLIRDTVTGASLSACKVLSILGAHADDRETGN